MNLNDPFVTLTLTLLHIICIAVGLVFIVLLALCCHYAHRRRCLGNSVNVKVEPSDMI